MMGAFVHVHLRRRIPFWSDRFILFHPRHRPPNNPQPVGLPRQKLHLQQCPADIQRHLDRTP